MLKRLHIQAVAVAGFLLLAPLASAAVRGTQEKPAPKQPAKGQKQEKRVLGAKDMADG